MYLSGFYQTTASLALIGMTGCISVRPEYQIPLQRFEQTELEGNPQIGTIVHIRQLHAVDYPPVLPDSHPIAKKTKPVIDSKNRAEIARCQYEIYKELHRGMFREVFSEGVTSTKTYPKTQRLLNLSILPLNNDTAPSFYAPGGVSLFASTIGGVTVHATYTLKEKQTLWNRQGFRSEQLIAFNESLVTPHILGYFDSHPGKRIALVFGAAHYFRDDLIRYDPSPSNRPTLTSVCWRLPANWELAPIMNPHCPQR